MPIHHAPRTLAGLTVLVLAAVLMVVRPSPVERLSLAGIDGLMTLASVPTGPGRAIVLAIDEASLDHYGQWPWPRAVLADVIDRAATAGAQVIGFDLSLAEPDRQGGDERLSRSLAGVPTILGVMRRAIPPAEGTGSLRPAAGLVIRGAALPVGSSGEAPLVWLDALREAAASEAALTFPRDPDGLVRRGALVTPIGDTLYGSMALALANAAEASTPAIVVDTVETGITGVSINTRHLATDGLGALWLRPRVWASVEVLEIASFMQMDDAAAKTRLIGRPVLIGALAEGLRDLHPTTGAPAVPGVLLHAALTDQLFRGDTPYRPDWGALLEALGLILMGGTVLALRSAAGWRITAGGAVCTVALWPACAMLLLGTKGWVIDPLLGPISLMIMVATMAAVDFRQTARDRRRTRQTFARYLAPEVVDHVMTLPSAATAPAATRHITVLFTDVEAFTALVEQTEPKHLPSVVNGYLAGMTAIVTRHGGTLDKIVGDALHCFFNAPTDQPDHAIRAVACARDLAAFGHRYAKAMRSRGHPFGRTRIGITTGPAIVGSFGGPDRLDYTAHGTVVNLAARLEEANKALGTTVLMDLETMKAARPVDGTRAGAIDIPGMPIPLDVATLTQPLAEPAVN